MEACDKNVYNMLYLPPSKESESRVTLFRLCPLYLQDSFWEEQWGELAVTPTYSVEESLLCSPPSELKVGSEDR